VSKPLDVHREDYISLATFRKTGVAVETAVWFAADPGDDRLLWVYTNGKAGKVKRIRANGRARVAACDVRGSVRGDWVEAEAHLASVQERKQGFAALEGKYGWKLRLALVGSRLFGSYPTLEVVALRLKG
jgi:PPOX class probable F420-dependent enzyme